ncbi:MAG: dihydropteroate synthase [Verrucomicrobiales bacterium]|nr:dihydropteroate synthase [Verrucomicrobiales bacterium]
MIFRARQFEFRFPRPAMIMGVVNVTPDSFSDGGQFLETSAAVKHALGLAEQGAEILDVGGESTRPNALPVPEEEELRRVLPVLEALVPRVRVPVSIDTQKPAVARAALAAGASIVNDVAANRTEDAMWRLIAETGAGYVAMHMQGTPQTMQLNPTYDDVVREVDAFFADRLHRLGTVGVALDQIVLDVGIGFGKAVEHNLRLLRHLNGLTRFRRPLLLGVSRKSFLGRVAGGAEASERLPAALACTCWAVEQGVHMIRTHDVSPTLKAIRMMETLMGPRD